MRTEEERQSAVSTGQRIKLRRKELGMTQEELAEHLYVSRTAVSKHSVIIFEVNGPADVALA